MSAPTMFEKVICSKKSFFRLTSKHHGAERRLRLVRHMCGKHPPQWHSTKVSIGLLNVTHSGLHERVPPTPPRPGAALKSAHKAIAMECAAPGPHEGPTHTLVQQRRPRRSRMLNCARARAPSCPRQPERQNIMVQKSAHGQLGVVPERVLRHEEDLRQKRLPGITKVLEGLSQRLGQTAFIVPRPGPALGHCLLLGRCARVLVACMSGSHPPRPGRGQR